MARHRISTEGAARHWGLRLMAEGRSYKGLLIGYARVSKGDEQSNVLQAKALRAAGCRRIFEEAASGGRWDRPELQRLPCRTAVSFDDFRDGVLAQVEFTPDQAVAAAFCRLRRSIERCRSGERGTRRAPLGVTPRGAASTRARRRTKSIRVNVQWGRESARPPLRAARAPGAEARGRGPRPACVPSGLNEAEWPGKGLATASFSQRPVNRPLAS